MIKGTEYSKFAVIYTDQIREDGSIYYGEVRGFRPYFYVPAESAIPIDDPRITGTEHGHVSIFGEELVKIFTKLPTDVSALRDQFGKYYEADILFPWRYRIDVGYVNKVNTVFYIDIEVAMGSKFDKSSSSYPITAMACYDSKSKVYHSFVWRGDLIKIEDKYDYTERITEKVNDNKKLNVILHKFSSEKDMLISFCDYFKDVNPDVVTAWNTSFDYPYIINRMYYLAMDPSVLSPLRRVGVDKYDGEAIIKGRYVLDLLQAYKKIHIGQLESFKLDDVGLFEFNVPKIKIEGTFDSIWKQDITKLIDYNIADLEICVKLNNKKKVIDFFEGISIFTGVPLDETLANSRVLDFYFLREAYKRKFRLPSADRNALPPNFEGAIVKEPVKGLHRNVICLDLTALYPSIIMAGNMSLETIDKDGDIKFGNNVSFRSAPVGFISGLIQDFLDRRKKIKDEMLIEFEKNGKSDKFSSLDDQQNVTKFLTNSIYGVLAFFRSRYFLEDIAKTITWVGREINLHTQRVVEENGYKVVAGDTDSVYVVLPDNLSLDEIVEAGIKLQDKINESYIGFAKKFNIVNNTFFIKFEKVYSIAVFCKKKRYIGRLIWKEGKTYDESKNGILVDVVGFESRRSDTSKFTKSFQKELFKKILLDTPKKELFDFIKERIREFMNSPIDYISMPKSFSKPFNEYLGSSANSIFINAAKWSNTNLGYDFGGGSKGLFIYTKKPSYPNGVVYMRGDEDKLKEAGILIDYKLMIEKTIYNKIDTIFEALGLSRDELETGQRQSGLEEWF